MPCGDLLHLYVGYVSWVQYCHLLSVSPQSQRRFSCSLHRQSLSYVCIVLRLKLLLVLYEVQKAPRTVMVFREQAKDKGHILECMFCLLLRFMNSYPLNWDIQDQCWPTHTMRHMLTICPSTPFRAHYPGNQPSRHLGIWHLDIGDQTLHCARKSPLVFAINRFYSL